MNVGKQLGKSKSLQEGIATIDGDEVSTEEQVITLTVVNLIFRIANRHSQVYAARLEMK